MSMADDARFASGRADRRRTPSAQGGQTIPTADRSIAMPDSFPPLDREASLFLDLDGTLVDLIDRPDNVTTDTELRELLVAVQARLDGRLAVVSGRSLVQLDTILGAALAARLALVASHGAEFRLGGRVDAPARPPALDSVAGEMRAFADRYDGVLLEEKSYGVGLHFRMAPEQGDAALALAATLGRRHGLFVQQGSAMVELRSAGHDKGDAVRQLMRQSPFADGRPVFLGDDITDEAGFAQASAMGGYGVLVGAPRPSAARFHLAAPAAVRIWLKELSL